MNVIIIIIIIVGLSNGRSMAPNSCLHFWAENRNELRNRMICTCRLQITIDDDNNGFAQLML